RLCNYHLPAKIRGAFGNERLWREKRIDREFNPTAIPDEIFLEQRVVDMMTGVALVRSQVDRPIDVDWQIGIHLDDAAIITLVPIVTAPWFIGDVFDAEIFARGQFDVRERAFATRLDGELKNRVQLFLGNHERLPPTLVTLQERSLTWKFRLKLDQDLLKVSFRKSGCNGVIKNLRFFIELQALAFQNARSRLERGRLLC